LDALRILATLQQLKKFNNSFAEVLNSNPKKKFELEALMRLEIKEQPRLFLT